MQYSDRSFLTLYEVSGHCCIANSHAFQLQLSEVDQGRSIKSPSNDKYVLIVLILFQRLTYVGGQVKGLWAHYSANISSSL